MTNNFDADVERLAGTLSHRFGEVQIRSDFGWPGYPSPCVLDCVLSLNRPYDRVVYPRVLEFHRRNPDVRDLEDVMALASDLPKDGAFFLKHLNVNYPDRERVFWDVVGRLLAEQKRIPGNTQWERLGTWAASVDSGGYQRFGVKGFGLSGWQYLRMLLGVQTTKPDVHVKRFVSNELGRNVTDVEALLLLESAARLAGFPLREVDGAIWSLGARGESPA